VHFEAAAREPVIGSQELQAAVLPDAPLARAQGGGLPRRRDPAPERRQRSSSASGELRGSRTSAVINK